LFPKLAIGPPASFTGCVQLGFIFNPASRFPAKDILMLNGKA
jgi:hypothetical protein